MSSHGDPARGRTAVLGDRVRILAGLSLLVGLLAIIGASPATAGDRVDPTTRAGFAAQDAAVDPPGPGDDFARLPASCYREPYSIVSPCRVTRYPGRPWMVLWGDSHALMYLSPIRFRAVQERVNLVVMTAGSCPIARIWERGVPRREGFCERHNEKSYDYLADLAARRHRVGLIANSFWANYRHTWALLKREQQTGRPSGVSDFHAQRAYLAVKGSAAMFKAISRLGITTDVIAQAGTVPPNARSCPAGETPYQCDLPRRWAMRAEADNDRWLARRVRLLPRESRVVDPSPLYCSAATCRAHVQGVDTWYDAIHVGEQLSRLMRPYFRPVFTKLLG